MISSGRHSNDVFSMFYVSRYIEHNAKPTGGLRFWKTILDYLILEVFAFKLEGHKTMCCQKHWNSCTSTEIFA